MMRKPKPGASALATTLARSIDFEVTIADLARRSERRAWWVACAAVVLALVLAAGYFYMLPLKQKVPYLVMADAYTGTSTIARLVAGPEYQKLTSSEAVNRSNIAHYILARESYDVTLLDLRDWNAVLTMSTPEVAAAYRALYSSLNPESPARLYGAARSIRIKILSIVLVTGRRGGTPTGAMVRFQRSLYTRQTGALQPLDNRIATLAFVYNPNLKMDERYRIDNPLGFLVTDYRVDHDYDSTPPMAVEVAERAPESPGGPDPDRAAAAPLATPTGEARSVWEPAAHGADTPSVRAGANPASTRKEPRP